MMEVIVVLLILMELITGRDTLCKSHCCSFKISLWVMKSQSRFRHYFYIKTYRKWSAQIGFCTILQHFLVIFWQTTLVSFTKLRFLWTFWGAKRVLILIGSKLQDKTKLFFVSVFFNFVRKKRENFWLINGHFTTISGHFSAN